MPVVDAAMYSKYAGVLVPPRGQCVPERDPVPTEYAISRHGHAWAAQKPRMSLADYFGIMTSRRIPARSSSHPFDYSYPSVRERWEMKAS